MHWYEDVMGMGLRDTLKEVGFKRKSRAKFVCDRSPDRVWVVEIHMRQGGGPDFNILTGIYVPAIGEILGRLCPEATWYPTHMRTPTHLQVWISDLLKIQRGWDKLTWDKNPESRSRFWGYRNPPGAHSVLAGYRDYSGWNPKDVEAAMPWLQKFSYALSNKARKFGDKGPPLHHMFATLWLGPQLDDLWRHFALDWLQRCDDPVYLAEWLDRYVLPECRDGPGVGYGSYAVTAAAAYVLVGNKERAGELLHELLAWLGHPAEISLPVEYAHNLPDWESGMIQAVHQLADESGIML